MTRSRVAPEKRQRSNRACVICKAAKVKCDGELPCSRCIKHSRDSACSYPTPAARQPRRNPALIFEQFRSGVSNENSSAATPSHDVSPPTTRNERSVPTATGQSSSSSIDGGTWKAPGETGPAPHGRTLLSSQGEKVYVGETASLSYLQFLRQVVRKCLGPSPFSDGEFQDIMFESDFQLTGRDDTDMEDVNRKKDLIQCFLEVTSGLLDIYSREELDALLVTDLAPTVASHEYYRETKNNQLAPLYLAIAIGGQCRGENPTDLIYATHYYRRAQQIAFAGMLCDPSLAMVRLFLLMAFYKLNASQRNAAFMYLGVASKAASALGLHMMGQYRAVPRHEQLLRLRIWRSLVVLDSSISLLLGRSFGTPTPYLTCEDIGSFESQIDPSAPVVSRSLSVRAAFEACILVDGYVLKMSNGNNLDIETTQTCLQTLKQWSQNLPDTLKIFNHPAESSSITTEERQHILGNIHVACLYYFAVILVTRQHLISHLVARLQENELRTNSSQTRAPYENDRIPRSSDGQPPHPDGAGDSEDQSHAAQLSQVCVDSAIFVAQMCEDAMQSGYLPKLMTLIKPWIFAAGLVLGFYIFAQGGGNNLEAMEAQQAFESCRTVLKSFCQFCPQATLYYDILTKFKDSFSLYHQKLLYDRRRITRNFIHELTATDAAYGSPNKALPSRSSALDSRHYPSPCLTGASGPAGDVVNPTQNVGLTNDFAPDVFNPNMTDFSDDGLYSAAASLFGQNVGAWINLPSLMIENFFDFDPMGSSLNTLSEGPVIN